MIRPDDPTAMPDYQIEPVRSPYFQILQPQVGTDKWLEVGFVWTYGASRSSCTESWYLYDSVPEGSSLGAYVWAGYDSLGKLHGASLRLIPMTPPVGQDPSTMKAYLERSKGVSLTYVVATMSAGR